jgi:hypothetical protein
MSYWKGIVTGASLVVAAGSLIAATVPSRTLGTIDVERINVREPDGTLRLVIAGRDRFPGEFVKGQEKPRPDRRHAAGMLFLNDEGTENGGLIWAGKKDASGVHAGASLTFDRYEQDQTLQLLQTDSGDRHNAALIINDQPPSQPEYITKGPGAKTPTTANRLFVGRSRDGAAIMLQDAKGTPRIFLRVKDDGTSSIDFLDQNGKVVRSLTPNG